MKLKILLFAVMAGFSTQAESDYRIFTDTEGRAIEGRIMSYDVRSGNITVERANHRKATVLATIFSETDQAYIKERLSAQDFLSNSKLWISVQKKKGKVKSQTKRPIPPCSYEIQMDNRSGVSFDNISVEYYLYMNSHSFNGGSD